MKAITFTLCFLLFKTIVFGQKLNKEPLSHTTTVEPYRISSFIDSLKTQIIQDTLKFIRNDLIHTSIGTNNKNNYSKLYLVDGKYLYKLDIISGQKVIEFVNEYLSESKIQSISITDTIYSQQLFGSNGISGLVSIQTKKKLKYNPKVAGLKLTTKSNGNNLWQRENDKLIIRN